MNQQCSKCNFPNHYYEDTLGVCFDTYYYFIRQRKTEMILVNYYIFNNLKIMKKHYYQEGKSYLIRKNVMNQQNIQNNHQIKQKSEQAYPYTMVNALCLQRFNKLQEADKFYQIAISSIHMNLYSLRKYFKNNNFIIVNKLHRFFYESIKNYDQAINFNLENAFAYSNTV